MSTPGMICLTDEPCDLDFSDARMNKRACTRERMMAHDTVLCIQDTTELDYTGKGDINGLGSLNYEKRRGLYLHPTLAVTPERLPPGLLDSWSWTRPLQDAASESVRCLEGYQRLCETQCYLWEQAFDTRLVYLADREGDLFSLYAEQRRQDHAADWLIRAQHDRCTEGGVKLLAREVDPPDGVKPIEWLLLSNLEITTQAQAEEKLSWYLCRCQIEIFFRILKSGCRVEELQLEHIDRLEPAIMPHMLIAWRVLFLTMVGRECPELPCDLILDKEEWQAVYMVARQQPPPKKPPTLNEMIRMLAGLSGFLNRKGDGMPGPQTIWIGLQRSKDFTLAIASLRKAESLDYG